MEEASSIIKAIEKGWEKAGHPKEFSVKIFEEPQKNFIGMTVKPAKIAIIFDQEKESKSAEKRPKQPQQKARPVVPIQPVAPVKEKEKEQEIIVKEKEKKTESKKEVTQPIWTDQMIETIKDWLKEFLKSTDYAQTNFTINADKYYLKINFASSLHENTSKERQIFAALSLLLIQSLKKSLNRPLKGYKIILMRNEKPV